VRGSAPPNFLGYGTPKDKWKEGEVNRIQRPTNMAF